MLASKSARVLSLPYGQFTPSQLALDSVAGQEF
jgi:hypothetical protein